MPVPAKLKITLYALDEQMKPGALIMSVAMYADDFPEDGTDHDRQRFIKGFLYNKFQEVLSVYFDVTVLHSHTKQPLFAYKDLFALPDDRRHLVWE
jgi:hypothetical protein